MVKTNNSVIQQEFVDSAKIQTTQGLPTELDNTIKPTFEVNPKLLRRCNIVKRGSLLNATSATLFSIKADEDFYIVAATLTMIKDVTSTSTTVGLTVTTDGVATKILDITGITLTPDSQTISVSFPFPLKADRGTITSLTSSTNVANVSAIGTIVGYYG
jgi:hypothetical protein